MWKCTVCGYEHRESEKKFEELEDNWQCPVCLACKEAFYCHDVQ